VEFTWVFKHPEMLDRWPKSEHKKNDIKPVLHTIYSWQSQTSLSLIAKPPVQRNQPTEDQWIQIHSEQIPTAMYPSHFAQVLPSATLRLTKKRLKTALQYVSRARWQCQKGVQQVSYRHMHFCSLRPIEILLKSRVGKALQAVRRHLRAADPHFTRPPTS